MSRESRALPFLEALQKYEQADPDGVMVNVSRQAVDEAVAWIKAQHSWIWSLELPEVSGWRWIETWDASTLEIAVRRFTVGETLPPNVACWRYVDPPKPRGERSRLPDGSGEG